MLVAHGGDAIQTLNNRFDYRIIHV
jgi:hypothetical protein